MLENDAKPRRAQSFAASALLCCAALLPARVWGEGAVRQLDCTVVQTCDASGRCEAASAAVAFRMEPVQVAQDGSGRYQIHYAETEAAMDALSDVGPFVWTMGAEHNALLASSESEFLWHRLTLAPEVTAVVRFLTCAVRQ